MRSLVLPCVVVAAALAALACGAGEADKLAEKKREPWLVQGGWSTDWDAARARAREEDKLIFAYFTRSYAT